MTKDYSRLVTHEWDFGGDKNLADKLKRLVLNGKKTATTGLFKEDSKIPSTGDYAAILGSDGKRFCIIQYIKIEIKPFLNVDYEYAKLEGEDDKNLEEWRQGHRNFFSREYGAFLDSSLLICEEFKLIQSFE